MLKSINSLLLAALLVLVITAVLQNTEVVETKLLFMTFSMPRAILLALTLLAGVVLGLFLGARQSR